MVYLPTSTGSATQWTLSDYETHLVLSTPADAAGVSLAQLVQVPQDELWLIERMVVQHTSTATTEARIYVDLVDPSRIVDGTRSGNFDVADESSPIQVPGGSTLLCQWTGATPGTRGTLRVQLTILRQETEY